ncbi:hypothetical protein SEUCBS140593_005422 [Sporothrix eucalyptigena]|uniref:Uncharacterized protein n=1 Tax=Sporothrix eucalyptigena TaxID=1812306 RepID=A0ABP0BWL8_9PEZI
MFDLKGKVAIITGSSSGIGLASAKLFLELGAKVYGVDISTAPAELQEENANFYFHQINLADAGAPEKVVSTAVNRFGTVDILLNIAGIMDTQTGVDNLDEAAWDKLIAINLTAPTLLAKHVVLHFQKNGGGNIVNVSSKAGISGAAGGVAYTVSKHGLIGMTKNTAWRYHKEKIRCNAICPGGIVTNIITSINAQDLDQEALKISGPVHALHAGELTATIPSKSPAQLMAFLASDVAEYINGAIIPVDNAWSVI